MLSFVRSTRWVLKSMLASITPPLASTSAMVAMMAGRLIRETFDIVLARSMETTSDWFSIATQAHRRGEKYRGERQPEPQTGRTQKSGGTQLIEPVDDSVAISVQVDESPSHRTHEPVSHQV